MPGEIFFIEMGTPVGEVVPALRYQKRGKHALARRPLAWEQNNLVGSCQGGGVYSLSWVEIVDDFIQNKGRQFFYQTRIYCQWFRFS